MSEEIFGDKPAHQVSVSEGSGNAGSSRGRSGKFKADTSRRINVDNAEGELVSRHMSSDDETHVSGGLGHNDPASLVTHPEHGGSHGVSQETDNAHAGPVQLRGALSDRMQSVSEGAAVENHQALPGGEDVQAQRIRIQAQAAADNLQVLPGTDARDAAKGPTIQADASHPAP